MAAKDTGLEKQASAEFDGKIFPLLALQKAAYELSSRAVVSIETSGDTKFLVTLVTPTGDASQVLGSFKARIADLTLQDQINEQTRTIRDALVSAALWESLPRKAS